MISRTFLKKTESSLFKATQRFYGKGEEPHVFVNKHTKVICQGMTGKHVSFSNFRSHLFQDLFSNEYFL